MTSAHPAVFLDRDGVLIEERHLIATREDVQLLPGVAPALRRLTDAGFTLVVVTNQTIVARGLASEAEVGALNAFIAGAIVQAGGPALDHFYVCPHHPQATRAEYRRACGCRKPRPGLLLDAAAALDLDLARSYLIGDRVSDILAGRAAGCRTVQVQTGAHAAAPIVGVDPEQANEGADFVAADLPSAAAWILR